MANDNFHYNTPNEDQYLKAIKLTLKSKGHEELIDLLKNATCSIRVGNNYSRKRWNALYTSVIFHLPMREFENVEDIDDDNRSILCSISDRVMPPEAGLDVMHIDFSPMLDNIGEIKTLENDLEDIKATLQDFSSAFTLPQDLMDKGQEMASVYLYLYVVENYLRLFIEKIGVNNFGKNYFSSISVPSSIVKSIAARREQEKKNQWLGVRGESELFYLDFKELGTLILNNWDLFRSYFPDQSWISSKIDELGNCRNLIAHNSYIGDHERDVIRVNFNSIVKQLKIHM